ncbi:MAG TPA: Dabb family protein, partial [Tepidisphaeraceae bacterium]|nr:Dabb family protein [Tepidisphaeraceae bacterium]
MFVHTVFFWLKPTTDDSGREQLLSDCGTLLAKIPIVRHVWFGKPAMTPRQVVDNSYHAALTIVLDDAAGHDAYQEHPLHKEFVAR